MSVIIEILTTSIPSTHPCKVSVDSNFINSLYMKKFNRHQLCHLTACGVRNRNAKERYVKILSFQHLARYMTFTTDGDDFRNKVLRDKIDVSVVLDIECVDMFTQCFD